jgi:hypothetical protein
LAIGIWCRDGFWPFSGIFGRFNTGFVVMPIPRRDADRRLLWLARIFVSLAGQEGGMSMLDLAVMGFYSFVGLIWVGLIVLLAAYRH